MYKVKELINWPCVMGPGVVMGGPSVGCSLHMLGSKSTSSIAISPSAVSSTTSNLT